MDSNIILGITTASLAAVGVGVAKDTKISEFRQQWADELRKDVSSYLALVAMYYEMNNGKAPNDNTQRVGDIILELNTVMHRVTLRLDLKDKTKKQKPDQWRLGEAMWAARNAARRNPGSRPEIEKCSEEIQFAASVVIDNAWTRVKKGEPLYRA